METKPISSWVLIGWILISCQNRFTINMYIFSALIRAADLSRLFICMIWAQNNGQSTIDNVQLRWTFYFVQTNFRSTSHFDRTCKLYTCMALKLVTRKIKDILTSLHHYIFWSRHPVFNNNNNKFIFSLNITKWYNTNIERINR